MWIMVVLLVFVCIITAIVYSHHSMKARLDEANATDVRIVNQAVEHSDRASNMKNTLLALLEAQDAMRTIEVLIQRNGAQRESELTGVNVQELLDTFKRQRDKILDHLVSTHPEILPQTVLDKYSAFARARNDSRQAHFASPMRPEQDAIDEEDSSADEDEVNDEQKPTPPPEPQETQ